MSEPDKSTQLDLKPAAGSPLVPTRASLQDQFWLDLDKELKKGGITKAEEAAKQLISVTSISQAIYFAAVSFGDVKKSLPLVLFPARMFFVFLLLFPLALWIGGLIHAILAFKPEEYLTNRHSPTAIEAMYEDILKFKLSSLNHAHALLWMGYLFALAVLLIYFFALPSPPPSAK